MLEAFRLQGLMGRGNYLHSEMIMNLLGVRGLDIKVIYWSVKLTGSRPLVPNFHCQCGKISNNPGNELSTSLGLHGHWQRGSTEEGKITPKLSSTIHRLWAWTELGRKRRKTAQ